MAAQDSVTRQSKGLVGHYSKCYEVKYGKKPVLNVYRDRWGFVDMLDEPSTLPYATCKKVIEYYFKTTSVGHPLKTLFINFDHLLNSMNEQNKDAEERAKLRKQTEQRVKEWEATHGER